jgi:hypothetical protein
MTERGKHGGAREGAGRKPKADEIKLLERLSPMDDVAFEKLKEGVSAGDFQFIRLFMEYRYGKPKQQIEQDIKINQPIVIDWGTGIPD